MSRETWEEATLGSRLLRIETGRSPSLTDSPAAPGQWGVLKVSAVYLLGYRPSENKAVDDPGLINERFEVNPGDLLFSRANTPELVGSACLATPSQERLMLSDKTLRLVVDQRLADAQFVNLVLASPAVRRQIATSASGTSLSMQNISQSAVEGLTTSWPSRSEQRRIVEVLSSFAEQERAVEGALAKLKILEEGVSGNLLEGISVGRFFAVGDLGAVITGMTPPASWDTQRADRGIPMITPSQVFSGGEIGAAEREIATDRRSGVRSIGVGATLAVCIGFGIGKVALTDFECCTNQQINSVVPYPDLDPRFVYLSVKYAMRQVRARANLQVTPIINKRDFSALTVAVPDGSEQRRIADAVWAVRNRQFLLHAESVKLRKLKQGLTDGLLSGKVRVRDVA